MRIDELKRVDETFGFDGCVMVNALFSPLDTELKHYRKPQNKVKCSAVGSVILEKVDKNSLVHKPKQEKVSDDPLHIKLTHLNTNPLRNEIIEMNPFNHKAAFKFNPEKVGIRKGSYPIAGDTSTEHSKIVDKISVRSTLTKNLENQRKRTLST